MSSLPNNYVQVSQSIICAPITGQQLTKAASRPVLPSRKLCLKHGFDDILLSTKPSWEQQATETVDHATWLLREHHWEYTIKNYCFCITCKTRVSLRPPTHWIRHRRSGRDEGSFLPPNPNKVFKYHCNTKEAGSRIHFVSARDQSTTGSQIRWIIFGSNWSTIWFFKRSHIWSFHHLKMAT